MTSIAKDFILEAQTPNGVVNVELALTEVKFDRKNKAKPNQLPDEEEGGDKGTQVFIDQGRIEENFEATVKIDREAAVKLDGSADREEVLDKIIALQDTQSEVDIFWGNRKLSGMLNQVNITERAKKESSQYEVRLRFLPGKDLRDGV